MSKDEKDRLLELFDKFKDEAVGAEYMISQDDADKAENALRSFVESLVRE